MVEIQAVYEGKLRCRARHMESGTEMLTDAPKDNQGNGESFSPTDLVATALGTCILTTMAIFANRHGIEVTGSKVKVTKEMTSTPPRRIARLAVTLTISAKATPEQRTILEAAAHGCPVHKSLHPDVEAPITIEWA